MSRLCALLAELEADPSLARPHHLHRRLEALDRIDRCLAFDHAQDDALVARAQALATRLDSINAVLYASLRDEIRAGRGAAALQEWTASAMPPANDAYDALDELVGGVLRFPAPQAPTVVLGSDMVGYQPTPVRHVLSMLARTGLGERDVLLDLGSGLGHVPLLAAILTKARAVGVDLEPAYVASARQAAASLALTRVSFLEQDARDAALEDATLFYLYTPFRGAILRDVLDRLRAEAERRHIRIATFGPCTPVVAREPWLAADDEPMADRIVVFHNVQ